MPSFRLVFDLDDTLYPERSFALGGFRAAGQWVQDRWGVSGVSEHMAAMLEAGHLGGLFKATLEHFVPKADEALLREFIDVYRCHTPELALYPDGQVALDYAASLGPVGLITDGTDWVQARKVQALELEATMHSIVYTFALGGRDFHKPHPRAFEVTQERLAVDHEQLVYVGDNPTKDFLAPNRLGWKTIQVLREQTIHDTSQAPPEGGAPDIRIDDLGQLPEVLDQLKGER